MTIYPAIDLRNGECVRLFRGLADQQKTYYEDPLVPALLWKKHGADFLHLIDLDGAFSGNSANLKLVEKIVQAIGVKVQLGGGMRDDFSIERALNLGVDRVIIGTRACMEPEWIGRLVRQFGPERIVVGIDAKDGLVATKGWVETSELSAIELAERARDLGAKWIIHTDISTDGAMLGPNLDAQRKIAQAVPECQIIASGGVTTMRDVDSLRLLQSDCSNLEGLIIGKALYEKTIKPSELFDPQNSGVLP